MNKTQVIIGCALVLVGIVLFSSVMMVYGWDFTRLSTVKYETKTYDVQGEFQNISIHTDTADILFAVSEDGMCKVECREEENRYHTVSVQDGELTVRNVDQRKWYEHIGIRFGVPEITVYIPEGEYGALSVRSGTGKTEIPNDFCFENMDISGSTGDVVNHASVSNVITIETSTGDIFMENVSAASMELSASTGSISLSGASCAGDLEIHVSTGKTYLTNVQCGNLISLGSTGNLALKNVTASGSFSIHRSTGDVIFESCDASEISVNTETGDVTGSLLTDKVFTVRTDTGKISIPKTATGGNCQVVTSTGDIRLDVENSP